MLVSVGEWMGITCDRPLLYSLGRETLLVASNFGALFICYFGSSTDFIMLLNILYGICRWLYMQFNTHTLGYRVSICLCT